MFTDADRALLQDTLKKADGGTIRADHTWQNKTNAASFAALTAAVEALASAQGVDASQVASIVDKAVRDRLAQVKFDVTDAPSA